MAYDKYVQLPCSSVTVNHAKQSALNKTTVHVGGEHKKKTSNLK
jgi:hypothetical protein